MAELNLNYYTGDDLYSDGDVEDELLKMAREGMTLDDLPSEAIMFPVIYHLSDIRENILNWYPFHSNGRVLEIGAGCGAITGMLCEKCELLVAVELSKRRATINYERHKHFDNLWLYVGNFNLMQFPFQFDYVVLNGVFEYAMGFTKGNEPYVQFLKNILPLLKEEGKILIAIENKLGLKYFAGAPEDHVGRHFFGLDNYPGNNWVRTFTKNELKGIFEQVGITHHRFYYPYPDYKFPVEVFTEETLRTCGYGKYYYNFENNRYQLFNEQIVSGHLLNENIMGEFSNSFLVEISRKDFSHEDYVSYAKMNSYRADKFKIMTTLEKQQGETIVYKRAMNKEAVGHINQMAANTNRTGDSRLLNLKGQLAGDKIRYPFIKTHSLDYDIKNWIKIKDKEKIVDNINDIYRECKKDGVILDDFQTPEFAEVFGPSSFQGTLECVYDANIDLICGNLFRQDSDYLVIDGEWIFDFYIPVQFIIYRLILSLYDKFNDLHVLIPSETFFEAFAINDKLAKQFDQWNAYFMNHYVGHGRVSRYVNPVLQLNLGPAIAAAGIFRRTCNLYYDTGGGFNEENKIVSHINIEDEEIRVDYDLSGMSDIKALRWDPLEGDFCLFEMTGTDVKLTSVNAAVREGNKDIFLTTDPIYIVDNKNKDKFSICGRLYLLDKQDIESYMLKWNEQKLRSEESYKEQLEQIYQSRDWKAIKKLRSLRKV